MFQARSSSLYNVVMTAAKTPRALKFAKATALVASSNMARKPELANKIRKATKTK